MRSSRLSQKSLRMAKFPKDLKLCFLETMQESQKDKFVNTSTKAKKVKFVDASTKLEKY